MMMLFKCVILFLSLGVFCFGSIFSPRDENDCPIQGLTCSADCLAMNYCPTVDGGPTPSILTCPDGTFCQAVNGAPACNAETCEKVFCGDGGAIPSPTNESLFYLCTAEEGQTRDLRSCPDQRFFNTETRNCTEEKTNRTAVKCDKVGTRGDLDNFCVVCLAVDTFLIYECRNSTAPTDSTPTEPPNKCTQVNQKFPDTQNCRGYYICLQSNGTLAPVHRDCRADSYYDSTKQSCVKGNC